MFITSNPASCRVAAYWGPIAATIKTNRGAHELTLHPIKNYKRRNQEMTKYIISSGEYVVYNIIIEAKTKMPPFSRQRNIDPVCGPIGHSILYQCEGDA